MSNTSHEASEQYPVIEGSWNMSMIMIAMKPWLSILVSVVECQHPCYDMNLSDYIDWLLDNSELNKPTNFNSAYYTADQLALI